MTPVCDPLATPILVGPDGAQVVLGDGPGGTSAWTTNAFGLTAFLRQIGECIWIIGYAPMEDRPDVPLLNAFHGRLGTDFLIVGTFSNNTGSLVPGYDDGELTYRVTFEGEEIVLIEDRSAGGPPGCSGGKEPVRLSSSSAALLNGAGGCRAGRARGDTSWVRARRLLAVTVLSLAALWIEPGGR